jgi:hypothetical protein
MPVSFKKPLLCLALGLLPVALPFAVAANEEVAFADHEMHHFPPPRQEFSPLIDKVRKATERFRDVKVAYAEGWAPGTPCVSGPDTGAMGVHFLQQHKIDDGLLNAETPEALIYEPLPGGAMRLVGVEFIELAADWATRFPDVGPPKLEGNLMNLVGEPNRFGLPAFYELHVWAWADNPRGSYADWNTQVSCDQQALDKPTA